MVGTFGLFLWDRLHDVPIDVARTVSVNTLVMFEIFYLLNTRYLNDTVLTRDGILGNRFIHITIAIAICAQLLFTYTAPMQHLFGSAAISLSDWVRIVIVSVSVFVLVESEKFIIRKLGTINKKLPEKLFT